MHLLNGHTIVSWPSALRQCIASYFLLLPATAVSCFTDATVRFMRWDIGTLPDSSACGCADRLKQLADPIKQHEGVVWAPINQSLFQYPVVRNYRRINK